MSYRIYVASLADYNAGKLHGMWIDDLHIKDGDQVLEEVKVMLAASEEDVAEEWAIHDHEGFGKVRVVENSRFDELCKLAALIDQHGHVPVAEATDHEDEPEEIADWIADHYCGERDSPAAYAEDLFEECYRLDDIPNTLRYHIDWEGVARDLSFDGYTFVQDDGTCHVFSP